MKRLAITAIIAIAGIGVAHAEPPRHQPRTEARPVTIAPAPQGGAPAQGLPLSPPPSWGRTHAEQYSTANGG